MVKVFLTPMVTRLVVILLVGSLPAPQLRAEHLVPPGTVRTALAGAASQRASDLSLLRDRLSTAEARQAASRVGADPVRLSAALTSLTDAELRGLAARAEALESDPNAGSNDSMGSGIAAIGGLMLLLLLILVGLVVLVVAS